MRVTLAIGFHPSKYVGGAEYQTWLLSRGLKQLGHSPTFLATGMQRDDHYVDKEGIPVYEIPDEFVSNKEKRGAALLKVLDKAQPDILYIRVFRDISFVADVCKANGIPFVSLSVHSMETSPFLWGNRPIETILHLRSGLTFRHFQSFYAIRDSAVHVCNLGAFQTNLKKWYPRKRIETIYNGSPVPEIEAGPKKTTGQIIFVNNIKHHKRPEVFINLAHHLPEYHFVMVGLMHPGRYGKKIERLLAEGSPNLEYVGAKSIDETNRMISESDLLVYPSLPVEGCANSFLQAWFRRVPVMSLNFEFDGLLEKESMGHCAQDFDDLLHAVDDLMRDHEKRRQMGEHARQFAIEHFTVDRMVKDYERLFREVVS